MEHWNKRNKQAICFYHTHLHTHKHAQPQPTHLEPSPSPDRECICKTKDKKDTEISEFILNTNVFLFSPQPAKLQYYRRGLQFSCISTEIKPLTHQTAGAEWE